MPSVRSRTALLLEVLGGLAIILYWWQTDQAGWPWWLQWSIDAVVIGLIAGIVAHGISLSRER